MEKEEKNLLNNDDEIKIDVSREEPDDYSDDFYDDDEDKCHCGCNFSSHCNCGEECECSCECCKDYDEEELPDSLILDFAPEIVNRGEEYYNNGHVESLLKHNNDYYAKVKGHDDMFYDVKVTIYSEEDAEYDCTCPCEYPCKHVYATLRAIANLEYDEIELKEEIPYKDATPNEILKKIPAENIKNYLLSPLGIENIIVNMNGLKETFKEYFPRQEYDYYYNKLYNSIKLKDYYGDLVDQYISLIQDNISKKCFSEAFDITKSIIEVFNDTKVLNDNHEVFDLLNKIGMFLRVIYRKADEETKNNLNFYANELKNKKYYDNYYLEDVMLLLK